jgi:hypothetical protein
MSEYYLVKVSSRRLYVDREGGGGREVEVWTTTTTDDGTKQKDVVVTGRIECALRVGVDNLGTNIIPLNVRVLVLN